MGNVIAHACGQINISAFGWPNAATWAAVVQAIAAAVICIFTVKLARLTARYAQAADDSVKLAREALDRDDKQAERAKQYFLRAIGMELDALSGQLASWHDAAKESLETISRGGSTGPKFAGALLTSVFSTQIEKLRDVGDPTLIEVIHFYSDLGILERGLELVNEDSRELSRVTFDSGDKESVRPRLISSLKVLQEQTLSFQTRLRELRVKLPPS